MKSYSLSSPRGGERCKQKLARCAVCVVIHPQVNHDVVIDTSLDPAVSITSVYTEMADGTYGVGEEILVTVVFSAPVS